ncbi:MAG: glycoside hydrolase family 13 protein, partial [Bacilli bacterium]
FESPNDDNGYDISDYEAVLAEFGTMDDWNEFLSQAHKRGIRVIIDLVLNHTSDEHPWFVESRASKDSAKRDWYIWRDGKNDAEPNNWESIFSGSAWEWDETTGQYYLHLFSRKQPDLNWENPAVRDALYEIVNRWLDRGVDGFRIDAISHIKKDLTFSDLPPVPGKKYVPSYVKHMNVDGIHTFLEEFKQRTYANYPDVVTVGEANGVGADEALLWVGSENGKMDMIFQFEATGLWNPETEAKLDVVKFKETMTRWQNAMRSDGWNALYIENHDKTRIVSTWGDTGEYWYASATAFATMYFFMRGTPFIYQGQEIGMSNIEWDVIESYNDVGTINMYRDRLAAGESHADLMRYVWASSRDSARTPMQWSAENHGGFTTGQPWLQVNDNYPSVNVTNQWDDSRSILSYYRRMITLRKAHEVLTYGDYTLLWADHTEVFAYTRTLGDEEVVVMANLTDKCVNIPFDGVGYALVLHNGSLDASVFELQPFEARVYMRN